MEIHTVELSQVEVDVLYYLMSNCGGDPGSSLRCIADSVRNELSGLESAQDDLMCDEFDALNIFFNSTGVGTQIANPSVVPAAWR